MLLTRSIRVTAKKPASDLLINQFMKSHLKHRSLLPGKGLILTWLFGLSLASFGQGTVSFVNTFTTLVRTNALAIAGGTAGNTAPGSPGSFYYALLTTSSTVTSVSASGQELLTPAWTFTGLYATNYFTTSGGRLSIGQNVPTLTGWPSFVTNSFVVVGWSTNLGTHWETVSTELVGANLSNGKWTGGAFNVLDSSLAFLGISVVGNGVGGGGTAFLPPTVIFGPARQDSNPIGGSTDLFVVLVPEPSTTALAALAGVLLFIRRRHQYPR
jgi:hypothetical protein